MRVRTLAGVVGLNPSYFGQVFRAATGLPPGAFLLGVRVDKARALLRTGRLSATRIAYEVGFSSQQAMTDAFRRLLGTVPRDYLPGGEKFRAEIERRRKWARWHFC